MNQEAPKKEVFKTSIITNNTLYEMIHDKDLHTTEYVSITENSEINVIPSHEINQVIFKPLPPDNTLVEKEVILFPSKPIEYGTESELLESVRTYIHKYVAISEFFEHIATYYIMFTWMYDKFNEVPYLRALGDFGSGKSRFLQTVGSICYKPIFTAGSTTSSPIFRILDQVQGTLILDEADYRFSDMTSDIVKILNTGYQKGTHVLRSEGKGVFEVKAYNVYGPKIIATREYFKDQALESRFLIENMGMSVLRSDIPKTLTVEFYRESQDLRNKLLMWRLKNYFIPINYSTEHIPNIHPRLNQIILPLLSMIQDQSIREKLKTFIIQYNSEIISNRNITWESDIVRTIIKLSKNGTDSLTVKEITDQLNRDRHDEWSEEPLTPRKVGEIIKNKLQIKAERKAKGFCISLKNNKTKIDFWKKRFGIDDQELENNRNTFENIITD